MTSQSMRYSGHSRVGVVVYNNYSREDCAAGQGAQLAPVANPWFTQLHGDE